MATRFLSDAEIARLESFPETIDERDLARYFALDADDLPFVRRQHSAAGQLGSRNQLLESLIAKLRRREVSAAELQLLVVICAPTWWAVTRACADTAGSTSIQAPRGATLALSMRRSRGITWVPANVAL